VQTAFPSNLGADGVQQVQKAQVDGVDFIRAVVPQNVVHGFDGLLIVLAVAAIADSESFSGVGVEKFKDALAPLIRSGCRVQCFGQDQSGGRQGTQLEEASAGELRAVGRSGRRRLHSHRFNHTRHPIIRSFGINGRLPRVTQVRLFARLKGSR